MFGFFTTNSRIAALQKTVADQAHDIGILIEKIERLESKVETLEGEFSQFETELDERVEREVEREVDNQLDGLEITISRR